MARLQKGRVTLDILRERHDKATAEGRSAAASTQRARARELAETQKQVVPAWAALAKHSGAQAAKAPPLPPKVIDLRENNDAVIARGILRQLQARRARLAALLGAP